MTFRDPIEWEATLPIRPSSPAWRCVIKALYGTPLTPDELALFRELSGLESPPEGGSDEFLAVVGRRGGKSEAIARLATFEACHGGHAVALAPGQTALIPIITPVREQAQQIVGYAHGIAALPQVRPFVAGEPTLHGVRFVTGVEIRVMTADAVAVSGPTVVCAVRDELAKFPGDDAATSDREIDNSLRPALAPVIGAPRRRLVGITSAYIREGIAFETDRDAFGKPDSGVLVVRGPTELFNPNIDRAWLARERRRVGTKVFAREYLAEWQHATTDGWFGNVIDRCVDTGRASSGPLSGIRYVAAIDAAFRGDRFALAIAHREHDEDGPPVTVIDAVDTWEPDEGEVLSVPHVVRDVAKRIRAYGAMTFADQFSFDPLRELFRRHGVWLREAPWTATSKPQRFSRIRAAMSDGLVRLPDDEELIKEFHAIRGRLLRSGGEQLEARAGHDDLAHAAVMAAYFAMDRSPDWGPDGQELSLGASLGGRGWELRGRSHDEKILPLNRTASGRSFHYIDDGDEDE
jgi:hypothetical protein